MSEFLQFSWFLSLADAVKYSFGREVERMGFDLKKAWRISYVNEDYGYVCSAMLHNSRSIHSMQQVEEITYLLEISTVCLQLEAQH